MLLILKQATNLLTTNTNKRTITKGNIIQAFHQIILLLFQLSSIYYFLPKILTVLLELRSVIHWAWINYPTTLLKSLLTFYNPIIIYSSLYFYQRYERIDALDREMIASLRAMQDQMASISKMFAEMTAKSELGKDVLPEGVDGTVSEFDDYRPPTKEIEPILDSFIISDLRDSLGVFEPVVWPHPTNFRILQAKCPSSSVIATFYMLISTFDLS